jgi:D-ribulokinase
MLYYKLFYLYLCRSYFNAIFDSFLHVVALNPSTNAAFISYQHCSPHNPKQKPLLGRKLNNNIIKHNKRRNTESLLMLVNKGEYDDVNAYHIGFDLGTSGARVSVIQSKQPKITTTTQATTAKEWNEVYTDSIAWDDDEYDNPTTWMDSIYTLFNNMKSSPKLHMSSIRGICFSGTSASCVLAQRKKANTTGNEKVQSSHPRPDDKLEPSSTRSRGRARMYNFNVDSDAVLAIIKQFAPERHTVCSPTSSLAKLILWNLENPIQADEIFCHQADYVAAQFISSCNDNMTAASDWHNCLKLGYDVRELKYPKWLLECLQNGCNIREPDKTFLPNPIVSPGVPIGKIRKDVADFLGIPATTTIVAGTTDSNAAFVAATDGMARPGTAVTSLGSTLAIKQVSTNYVEDSLRGVYSHRFPSTLIEFAQKDTATTKDTSLMSDTWLVGGASNVGCSIFRKLDFSNNELNELSKLIDPATDSPLLYYPLLKTGERFPISDPYKEPLLEPIPKSRVQFLHGILQGITNVERDGFIGLGQLGSNPATPTIILTCGGGAQNPTWIQLRQRILQKSFSSSTTPANVLVQRATNVEASYGAAILAASTVISKR